jgi:hypothetical protein
MKHLRHSTFPGLHRKQMPDGAFLIAVKSGNQIVASSKIVR